MYFFDLPGFHPLNGINTDDHGKYLHFKDTVAEHEPANLIDFHFPFKTVTLADRRRVFISEKNLISILTYDPNYRNDLLIDHTQIVTKDQLNAVKEEFYKGYFAGISDFPRQIQSTINLMDSPVKEAKLRNFIEFCSNNLFFEGFATPTCLYALGFIQAYLVKAFGEYQNLIPWVEEKSSSEEAKEMTPADTYVPPVEDEVLVKEENQIEQISQQEVLPPSSEVLAPEQTEKLTPLKIPLDYPAEEIISLWMILLEVWKCRAINSVQVFFSPEDVHNLLGSIFDDSAKGGILPKSEHVFYNLPPGKHERILNLLMHVTYKLNTDRNNIGLEKYCEALIGTFSCYNKTKVASLKSNINKERGNIIQSVKSLPEDSYKNGFLKVLGMINEYVI